MISDDYNKLHVVVNKFSLHRESRVRCRKRDCATCARANNLHNVGRKIALRLSFSVAMSRMNASTRGLRLWPLLRAGTAPSTLITSTAVKHCGRHLHTKQSHYHMTQSVPKQITTPWRRTALVSQYGYLHQVENLLQSGFKYPNSGAPLTWLQGTLRSWYMKRQT